MDAGWDDFEKSVTEGIWPSHSTAAPSPTLSERRQPPSSIPAHSPVVPTLYLAFHGSIQLIAAKPVEDQPFAAQPSHLPQHLTQPCRTAGRRSPLESPPTPNCPEATVTTGSSIPAPFPVGPIQSPPPSKPVKPLLPSAAQQPAGAACHHSSRAIDLPTSIQSIFA
ncbi:early nodulin-like protein 1 [Corylus avellana]|uniref:early nodulin-like protein 1 n=1 Tax=Corylus avellana TaxID=13451 RepID=UPI00286D02C8|nr:early nodulin-like protein 1 [Corylus avellana]